MPRQAGSRLLKLTVLQCQIFRGITISKHYAEIMEKLEIHTNAESSRLKVLEGDLGSWSVGGMRWELQRAKRGSWVLGKMRGTTGTLQAQSGWKCPQGLGTQITKSPF